MDRYRPIKTRTSKNLLTLIVWNQSNSETVNAPVFWNQFNFEAFDVNLRQGDLESIKSHMSDTKFIILPMFQNLGKIADF